MNGCPGSTSKTTRIPEGYFGQPPLNSGTSTKKPEEVISQPKAVRRSDSGASSSTYEILTYSPLYRDAKPHFVS